MYYLRDFHQKTAEGILVCNNNNNAIYYGLSIA